MKKLLLTTICVFCAAVMMAQKIDFHMLNRSEAEGLEPGYTAWVVTETESATKTFGDITVTVSADPSVGTHAGVHVISKYWKQGVVNYGYKLLGDGLLVCGEDHSTVTEGAVKLDVKVEGLSTGQHSLQAYHNNVEGQDCPPIDVYVNGERVLSGVAQSNRKGTIDESGKSYVEFNATAGEPVTISYVTVPEEGVTYTCTTVTINALVFNESDNTKIAQNPVPAKNDLHVDADGGNLLLQWQAAEGAVRHHVWLGTSEDQLTQVTTTSETSFAVSNLKSINTYYWRVDEEDANGKVTKGELWNFRPRQLAFPGAEGYGRYAIGGRGGIVYHVTTLSGDPNEQGSFLYGLINIDEPRYIVFDVSGTIELDIDGIIANNTSGNEPKSFPSRFSKDFAYIAGQTAPGKGVCIKSSNIGLGSDVICRHMRFKRGADGYTGNALGCGNDHTIIDHTTAAWGTDETLSTRGAKNVTFQYSMISEALGITGHKKYSDGKNHGFAATIGGSIGSFSHNLLVNCAGRNWSMGGGLDGEGNAAGELDMFNNVCYNWNGRTTDGGARWMQFVNNYYKMGVDTKNTVLFTAQNEDFGHRSQFAYVSGNIRENKDHTLTYDKKGDTYTATGPEPELTWYDVPFFPSCATIHNAKDAFKIVTSYAGATMPCRDDQHLRNVEETLKGIWTYKGSRSGIKGEIDHEDDAGGWETYPEEQRAANWDTDQDGMPDWWEAVVGSNASVANHNDDPNGDGWTLLEDYLEFMAHPYVIVKPGEQQTLDVKPYFIGFFGQNGSSVTPTFQCDTQTDNGVSIGFDGSSMLVTASSFTSPCILSYPITVNDGETTWSQRFGVVVTDGATGIHTVVNCSPVDTNSPYYDLLGRQVQSSKLPKGLYIHNGKKVVVP